MIEHDAVSGNRPATQDHQRKRSTQSTKPVGLARITYYGDTHAVCSCGWSMGHIRPKALENGVDRHLSRKHQGRGIRL
jgi:hypothetical protein